MRNILLLSYLSACSAICNADEPSGPLMDARIPLREVNSSFENASGDVLCNLGDVFTSTKYRIEANPLNKSNSTFEATRLKASCGCIAGLSESVLIEQGQIGKVLAVFKAPQISESFEKVIYLHSVLGDELRVRLQGKSVSRIVLSASNLVVQENTKKPQGLFVLAKSALNDNLSELLWSAECEHPTSIECVATSNEGEYRIDIAMDLKSVVKTDPSTVVHLKARTKDGLEYFETDFRVSFGFNVSTSPRILVLKKQTDEYLGMVIVRKTDYLNDEIREVEKQLELQSGESYGNRTPIFAKVSRMKNGSFLVKFRLVAADVPRLDDFEKCRLVLDLEKPEFNIPVLFQ